MGLLCHQSRPREEERAGPRSSLGQEGPEFRVRRPQGGGRGRRCSDWLREEGEPLEPLWSIWTEFCRGDPGEEERGRRVSDRPEGGGTGLSYYLRAFAPK